jgi:hypothetical protein
MTDLTGLLVETQYEITNEIAMYEHMLKTSRGYYILLSFLSIVLLSFVLVMLTAMIIEITDSNRNLIRTIFQLGADRDTLEKTVLSIIRRTGIIAVVVTILISLAFFEIIASLSNIYFSLNALLFHMLVALVIFFAFMFPARISIKRLHIKGETNICV